MSFKFTIDSDKLDEILTAIDVMNNRILMNFNPSGVSVIVVDPANVGMVSVTIPAEKFKSYEADETEFWFSFDELLSSLKIMNKDGHVEELHVKQDETGAMVVQSDFITRTFHPLSPSEIRKSPKWIDLKLPASAEILARDWVLGMETLNLYYDFISTTITSDSRLVIEGYIATFPSFHCSDKGEFTGRIVFEKTNRLGYHSFLVEKVSPAATDVMSYNSIEYIIDIARTFKKCGMVKILLGDAYPVIISAILPKSEVLVEYMVAPRVESE